MNKEKDKEKDPIDQIIQSALKFAKKVAAHNKYELNPNGAQVQRLTRHLADNKANHGRYFCPCKQHYPLQTDTDPICPCPTFHDEIKQQGHCECHLFFSTDAALRAKLRPGLLADVTCPGWASKIPQAQLALALRQLPKVSDSRILVGHNNADDAGILKIDDSLALVTSVDLLAPVVDDPCEYGFIAATNCLSDIYAMGGDPLVCLNVVGWPTSMSPDVLGEILKGSQDAVLQAGAVVLGGHTFQDSEIRYGLAVTGRIDPRKIYTNSGAQAGDDLILTKPLGTGTVVQCAVSRGAAPEETAQRALTSMKTSNASAARMMRDIGAHACTDITGYGFLGHCCEMAAGSALGLEIWTEMLPTFPMVRELIIEGIIDGSHKMNMNSFQKMVSFEGDDPTFETLLYSSETSGGLLIAVDPATTDEILARMRDAGIDAASVVGAVVNDHPGVVRVTA